MNIAPPPAEAVLPARFIDVLWQVRWVVLVGLLALSVAQPLVGRIGLPTWSLVLLFLVYNLGLDLLRRTRPPRAVAALFPLIDLLVAAVLYAASAAPGGPVYVLTLLAVACAAATLPLRAGLIYTGIAAALIVVVAPRLPFWRGTNAQVLELGAEVMATLLVGVGTALLSRQLGRTQAEAQASREEALRLSELNTLRTQFFAGISHELRTPLTALKASLGLLDAALDDRMRPEECRLLDNARRNVARLEGLISDLLALNQLQAGVLALDVERLDLRDIVAGALQAMQPLLVQRGHRLAVTLPEPLPALGDQRRLEQVVVNLLANANEHTPAGTPIQVTGQTDATTTTLTISDSGPGIPPAVQARLFEPFQRGLDDGNGRGLGLLIVKGIVELHGGQVQLTSAPGTGPTVTVSLPHTETEHQGATRGERSAGLEAPAQQSQTEQAEHP